MLGVGFAQVGGVAGFTLLSAGMYLLFRQIRGVQQESKRRQRQVKILYHVIIDNKLQVPPEFFDEFNGGPADFRLGGDGR